MARRGGGGGGQSVELFPFLSVLACTIGALVLLISVIAILQMETGPEQEVVERAQEYEKLSDKQKELVDLVEDLLPQLANLEELRTELKEKQALLAALQDRLEELEKSAAQAGAQEELLEQQHKQLLEEIAQLELRKQQLEKELAALQEELAKRKQIAEAPTITVEPSRGGGRGKLNPVFVEADGEGIILDPDGRRQVIPTNQIRRDKVFQNQLDVLSGDYSRPLLFLIRADGAQAYNIAEAHARRNNVMVSKLPLLGEGRIDLSKF